MAELSKATTAFVVGNGESRSGYELEQLRDHGPIFGCNALYRDFEPDVLTVLDHGMMTEVKQAYGGKLARFDKKGKLAIFDEQIQEFKVPRGGWYTGIAALWFASNLCPKLRRVFMIGFDLYDSRENNIYKGTLNYERMGINNGIQNESFKNFVFEPFPKIKYYRVGEVLDHFPTDWRDLKNIKFISYQELSKALKKKKKN